MPNPTTAADNPRLNLFKNDLGNGTKESIAFEKHFEEKNGDWLSIKEALGKDANFKPEVIDKLSFTHDLANWTGDNETLTNHFQENTGTGTSSLKDVALNFDKSKIRELLTVDKIPAGTTEEAFVDGLEKKLFNLEPTAMLGRMIDKNEVLLPGIDTKLYILDILNNPGKFGVKDFNIKETSVYAIIKHSDFLKDIKDEGLKQKIENDLKTAQRLMTISPDPASVKALIDKKYTSALQITLLPRKQFVASMGDSLPEETLRHIYTAAQNKKVLYEHMLVNISEAYRGTGVAAIDGTVNTQNDVDLTHSKKFGLKKILEDNHISWKKLFGDADFCECGECTSMYSPAAYYVELLQYLRNNNLSDKNLHTGEKGYKDTPLEKLFDRRPDLGHLELTCKNTNTILPYVDLVNEVMEQYIAFKEKAIAFNTDKYKGFNVADETSGELLSAPQHTEQEKAYQTISEAVFPFTLPYHQPIDAARIFLNYLGSSRYELMDMFEIKNSNPLFSSRPSDAEFLNLIEKEYGIITKQNFMGVADNTTIENCYGIKLPDTMSSLSQVKEKFLPHTGIEYTNLVELLKTEYINPGAQSKQITGFNGLLVITNTDSCSLEEARLVINSVKPSVVSWGKDRIDVFVQGTDGVLYTKSWDGSKWNDYLPLGTQKITGMPSVVSWAANRIDVFVQGTDGALYTKSWNGSKWNDYTPLGKEKVTGMPSVVSWAENKIDVFGQGADGTLYTNSWDGSNWSGYKQLGEEKITGMPSVVSWGKDRIDVFVQGTDGALWTKSWNGSKWSGYKQLGNQKITGMPSVVSWGQNRIDVFVQGTDGALYTKSWDGSKWNDYSPLGDEKITGMPSVVSWGSNRIDVFVQRTDGALWTKSWDGSKWSDYLQLGTEKIGSIPSVVSWAPNRIDVFVQGTDGTLFTKFWDGSMWGKYKQLGTGQFGEFRYPKLHRFIRLWRKLGFTIDETDKAIMALGADKKSKLSDITPDLIHQLVSVKKIINLTGIELTKLLCFWGDISTAGENSLYKRLFLTHNLQALDSIFKTDNGKYLNTQDTINQHLPAVMAALNLTADDIEAIRNYKSIEPDKFFLSVSNLSLLYRYRLLSKTMGLRIPVFIKLLKVFGDVFNDADTTLQFLQNWGKIEEAGFSAEQLSYIINGADRDTKPFAPSEKDVLVFAKQLYDGLNDIEATHGNVKDDAEATTEFVRAKALLLFDAAVTGQIINILDAPVTFTTQVDRDLDIDWPDPNILKDKVGYDKSSGILTIIGVLNDAETLVFNNLKNKAIPAVPGSPAVPATATTALIPEVPYSPEVLSVLLPLLWSEGLLEIVMLQNTQVKKMHQPFQLVLSGLLGSADAIRDSYCNIEEPAKRRHNFLNAYLPYLRTELAKKLVTDLLANATALDKTIIQALVFNILRNSSISLYDKLAAIKESAFKDVKKAYLLPQVGADYTFVVKDNTIQLSLDSEKINFLSSKNANEEYWSSMPKPPLDVKSYKLDAVKVYSLSVNKNDAFSLKDVFWKTPVTVSGPIPSSQLIPQEVFDICMDVLTPIKKLALLISTFNLSADELNYLKTNGDDFSVLNFNHLGLPAFLRLTDYCSLRNSLPQTKTNILEFLKWATNPGSEEKYLIQKISALTSWNAENITKLISSTHFNISSKGNFRNEQNLLKLQKALSVAEKTGIDIDRLFEWTLPVNDFVQYKKIANSIQKAIRSRYNQTDWEQVVKPLNDQLRNNQKNALIAYLLRQDDLKKEKVKDADGLFEYFLIDVQMDTCMETSRIKQAISSVQLFIQRCFIGLESKIEHGSEKGVGATVLDRGRWEWMQRYRVWEANRKVLLYPENWIESNLRDDKSPFFKELESELLQKDINKQNVTDALKTYLYKVDEVANMEVVGLYIEEKEKETDEQFSGNNYDSLGGGKIGGTDVKPYTIKKTC